MAGQGSVNCNTWPARQATASAVASQAQFARPAMHRSRLVVTAARPARRLCRRSCSMPREGAGVQPPVGRPAGTAPTTQPCGRQGRASRRPGGCFAVGSAPLLGVILSARQVEASGGCEGVGAEQATCWGAGLAGSMGETDICTHAQLGGAQRHGCTLGCQARPKLQGRPFHLVGAPVAAAAALLLGALLDPVAVTWGDTKGARRAGRAVRGRVCVTGVLRQDASTKLGVLQVR